VRVSASAVGHSAFTDSKCETLNIEFVVNIVPPVLASLLDVMQLI
jgi:hypothetical protein